MFFAAMLHFCGLSFCARFFYRVKAQFFFAFSLKRFGGFMSRQIVRRVRGLSMNGDEVEVAALDVGVD